MAKKRITAAVYTHGRFGRGFREILDTNNPYLYSHGRYPTKLTDADMPEDYIPIHSRSIWYMNGYLRTSGIVDMDYRWARFNHLFKDDCIYISYREKLRTEPNRWGSVDYINYDVRICGNDIVNIVLAAGKYSGLDTTGVRRKIEEKRIWLREHHSDEYERAVGEDEDIFTLWQRKGYILERLIPEE